MFLAIKFLYGITMSFIGLDALIMLINRFPKIVHLLAYVFVDGQNLNLDLVRQGLSPYYTKYSKSEK